MGKLIGNARSENVGEDLFLAKAMEYFDDGHIIYWNRQLFGREFDVCILMPGKGILVVELKGWRPETVLRVEDDAVIIRTEDGEKAEFPQKQARGHRFSLQRHIRSGIGKTPPVFQMVGLPQITGAGRKPRLFPLLLLFAEAGRSDRCHSGRGGPISVGL